MVNVDGKAEVHGRARRPHCARRASTHGALVAGPAPPAFRQGADRSQLVAFMLLSLRETGWLQSLELSAYDTLITFFAGSQQSDRVVLVVTTEADINLLGLPDPRHYLAAVLVAVFAAGPKTVGVDLYRDLPMAPGNRELQAIQRAHDNLYWVLSCRTRATVGFRRRRRCATPAVRCCPIT